MRRAFLCDFDALTGQTYEHWREWVVERLRKLDSVFVVDICAYAAISNHSHLVLRTALEQAESWPEEEVIERWQRLLLLPSFVHDLGPPILNPAAKPVHLLGADTSTESIIDGIPVLPIGPIPNSGSDDAFRDPKRPRQTSRDRTPGISPTPLPV